MSNGEIFSQENLPSLRTASGLWHLYPVWKVYPRILPWTAKKMGIPSLGLSFHSWRVRLPTFLITPASHYRSCDVGREDRYFFSLSAPTCRSEALLQVWQLEINWALIIPLSILFKGYRFHIRRGKQRRPGDATLHYPAPNTLEHCPLIE